jgi:CRISPR-associated endonuclease/helicase Cas3
MAEHERLVAIGDEALGLPGARGLASTFGAGELGELLGLWHDLGKYSAAFQAYIRADPDAPARVDHSTAGARHAVARDPVGVVGRLLAHAIAGHHAGLPDEGLAAEAGTFAARLAKDDPAISDALTRAPATVLNHALPSLPPIRPVDHGTEGAYGQGFQLAFLGRMLFSCLVDADYTATESYMNPDASRARREPTPALADLGPRLDAYITTRAEQARAAATARSVLDARAAVLRDARAAAGRSPGFFTFTVPTGGGKTLASMAFALAHARRHALRRVIVAVPYTSIIDQNAEVYRAALGEGAVLEHHSNFDHATLGSDVTKLWHRQTAETWDSPVVVTTTVQLFESLFSARPGTCRKLHRLAGSVLVLDEAQTLPVTLLTPILAAMRELVANYGCSVVLCTATQPALQRRANFKIGLDLADREIVADRETLFDQLRRTHVRTVGPRDDDALVDRLLREPQALCIVNTRKHAASLYRALERADPTALHLSALMCPAHRSETIARVRDRLGRGEPCRAVSTQVVEAGVDVDFPLVLRALAGMDSIAQSAGRCNREGRLNAGQVEVFEPSPDAQGRMPRAIELARDAARQVLPDHADDPLAPSAMHDYFRLLYWQQSGVWDHRRVMDCFTIGPGHRPGSLATALNFREAGERFRMIEDGQRPVVVPYGEHVTALLADLESGRGPNRDEWRVLQRHSVNIPHWAAARMLEAGLVADLRPNLDSHILTLTDRGAYDSRLGLTLDTPGISPEVLVC